MLHTAGLGLTLSGAGCGVSRGSRAAARCARPESLARAEAAVVPPCPPPSPHLPRRAHLRPASWSRSTAGVASHGRCAACSL